MQRQIVGQSAVILFVSTMCFPRCPSITVLLNIREILKWSPRTAMLTYAFVTPLSELTTFVKQIQRHFAIQYGLRSFTRMKWSPT